MGTSSESVALERAQPVALSETAASAVAAMGKASIEAAYIVARNNPRNWLDVRSRILEACQRPTFAEKARYAKPVGREKDADGNWVDKKVPGFSIRFAEEMARSMENVSIGTYVLFDDAERRIVRVMAVDLQANVPRHIDIIIRKEVERSSLKPGQTALGERLNSNGKKVYLVEATEDDLLVKQSALVAKAERQLVLKFTPADILEDAEEACLDTVRTQDKKDPTRSYKRICDAFYKLGIEASQIEELIGHDVASIRSTELDLLRTIGTAIAEGDATWDDALAAFGKAAKGKTESDASDPPSKGVAALKERLGAATPKKAAPKKEQTDEEIRAEERAMLDREARGQ